MKGKEEKAKKEDGEKNKEEEGEEEAPRTKRYWKMCLLV